MQRALLFSAICLLYLLASGIGHTAEVTLAWDPNDEPDIAGYAIYHNIEYSGPPYGYSGAVPVADLEDPDRPECTITELEEDTIYYFAVTAYDDKGNESGYSDEVCVQVQGDSITACPASSNGESGNSAGGCFINSAAQKPSSSGGKDFIKLFSFLCLLILGILVHIRDLRHFRHFSAF